MNQEFPPNMNRRDFALLLKSLISGASLISATKAVADNGLQNRRLIIVIGAGLAGLAAARKLKAYGHDVLILEGRNRIGGRVHTSTLWSDMPVDLGASWIHETTGNPLTALATAANATMVQTSYDDYIGYDTDGSVLTTADETLLDDLRTQVYDILGVAQDGPADQTLRAALNSLVGPSASADTKRLVNFILSSEMETEYAGSASQLSTYWYDNVSDYAGPDKIFAQGYRVIIDQLAAGLRIELGKIVTSIDWTQPNVRVVTTTGEYSAQEVLVTLPLGVLKTGQPTFIPALPTAKQQAITKLGMGVLDKCFLRFATAFWPANVDWIEYIPAVHGEWTEWVSFVKALGKPVLMGFHAADSAVAKEALTDAQIVASAMTVLRTIYGNGIPNPIDYQITRWGSDPFSLGSYSFNAVNSTPAMRKQLAAPLSRRLFFAGEATEETYFATAHGAYLSGLRAADEMEVPVVSITYDKQSSPPAVTLSWASIAAAHYTIEQSTTMTAGSWTTLASGILSGGALTTYRISLPAGSAAKKFYRVVKE